MPPILGSFARFAVIKLRATRPIDSLTGLIGPQDIVVYCGPRLQGQGTDSPHDLDSGWNIDYPMFYPARGDKSLRTERHHPISLTVKTLNERRHPTTPLAVIARDRYHRSAVPHSKRHRDERLAKPTIFEQDDRTIRHRAHNTLKRRPEISALSDLESGE
jgi:hypothetical protein